MMSCVCWFGAGASLSCATVPGHGSEVQWGLQREHQPSYQEVQEDEEQLILQNEGIY